MLPANQPIRRPTPTWYCDGTPVTLSQSDGCRGVLRAVPPSCPSDYYEAYRFPRPPILSFFNDVHEPLVIHRIDVAGYRAVTVEPGCQAVASNGGAFFGRFNRDQIAQGQGILVGVFDTAGHQRGSILFTPAYLNGAIFRYVCLSFAVEPPLVVNSHKDIRDRC